MLHRPNFTGCIYASPPNYGVRFFARAFLVPAVWASSSAQHTYLTTPPVLVILHQNNARIAHLVGVLDRHRLVTPVDGANQLVAGAILSQGGRPH